MELNTAIKSRRSVRKFKSKKPDWRKIIECIDSVRFAPMAGDNFSVRIILVDDKEKIEKIAKAAQQDFILQANYIIVVCSYPHRTLNAYGKRGERYSRQQAGAAIQNLLLRLEEEGLSTCWVGHFVDEQIKSELKIPEDVDLEAILPIGYGIKKPTKEKARIELDNILYFNVYKNKRMTEEKKIEGRWPGPFREEKREN